MIKCEDKDVLTADIEDEYINPLPQKKCGDGRIIYLNRNDFGHTNRIGGIVRITDFDRAVFGKGPHKGCIQNEVYRAPEVMLDAGYSYSADIWGLGVMVIRGISPFWISSMLTNL